MKQTDPKTFQAEFVKLETAFRYEASPAFIKLAFDVIGAFKPETIASAVLEIIANEDRFPSIATFRRYCSEASAKRNATVFNNQDMESFWRSGQ